MDQNKIKEFIAQKVPEGYSLSKIQDMLKDFDAVYTSDEVRYPCANELKKPVLNELKEYVADHKDMFGYEIKDLDGVSNTIVTGGMGRERNLIVDKRLKDFTPVTHIKGEVNRDGIRRMTPREWARLQGFPDEFKIVVADASAYKQFGNSVAIPAIQATAEQELKMLNII